ncbi:MAG: HNH endonuclease [Holophagales bacterium]|jgi:hypothetical protein|nr:HNH endonuclease [Holophagales bacterium]
MLTQDFVPKLPFANFKWKWASLQCTEGINDPIVLLGVLFRMRKLEQSHPGIKFSSDEFIEEMRSLETDIKNSVANSTRLNLSRTGDRNLMRNSGQYWRALNLLTPARKDGQIRLTEFGQNVADRKISQTEFAAITIQTFKLPNPNIQRQEEIRQWEEHGICIYPLRLLLSIARELYNKNPDDGFVTVEELTRIVIPLSAVNAKIQDYTNFITWFRNKQINLNNWPICYPRSNDERIAREYLLYLSHYGYFSMNESAIRKKEKYAYNYVIDTEISAILEDQPISEPAQETIKRIVNTNLSGEIERKRSETNRRNRPNQSRFRREILNVYNRCIITDVSLPEVLEAAHIIPVKYKGEDTVANGFLMRMDIHLLFDVGHLRISESGLIDLSLHAEKDYEKYIPQNRQLQLPDTVNKEFLRWRWNNYNGI